MKTIKKKLATLLATFAMAASLVFLAAPATSAQQLVSFEQLSKKVRKELVTLPYYGVFDNLAYKIDGGTVTLLGQVVQPSTRRDAERRVARLKGVERVVNQIEVLPLSGFDDDIRRQTLREIRRTAHLYRYFLGSNPSLHIIVNRGHVTLEGVVSNNGDRNLAYMAARSVPGVFSVTNNLRTDREGRF